MSDKLTLEEHFEKIEQIVSALEDKNVSLEKSFSLYKEGIEHLAECNKEIAGVEKKVIELNSNGETNEFQ